MVNNSVVSEPAFFCRFALIMANSVPIRILYPKNRNMHDNLSKIYDNLSKQAVFEVFFCVSEVVLCFSSHSIDRLFRAFKDGVE